MTRMERIPPQLTDQDAEQGRTGRLEVQPRGISHDL